MIIAVNTLPATNAPIIIPIVNIFVGKTVDWIVVDSAVFLRLKK